MSELIYCPDCDGEGHRGPGFITTARGCEFSERLPCLTCGATGRVDPGLPTRKIYGSHVKSRRLERRHSLREHAEWLDIRPSVLSRIEHGTYDGPLPANVVGSYGTIAEFDEYRQDAIREEVEREKRKEEC